MLVADPDGNMVEWEILSSHTKESIFQKSIPVLPPAAAAFFGFLNLVPGIVFYIFASTYFYHSRGCAG